MTSKKTDQEATPDAKQEPDFETQLNELETLVEKLESGELNLNESLDHFRRGVELARNCRNHLDQARLHVEELTDVEDPSSGRSLDSPD